MCSKNTLMITAAFILCACGERATEPAVDGAPPQPDTGVLGDNTTCTKADPISLYSGIASISGSTATSINEYGTSINCGSSVSLMRAPQRYYLITLTLGSGTTTINGDTTAIPNEFGTAINCGNYSTILKSSQVYFAFSLTGAKVYTFTLTPDYSSARFYLFGSTCDYTSINSACGSKGLSGFVSEYVSKGQTKSMTFSPTTTGNYTLAVDGTSTSSYAYGKFKLEITTK
jgi:hypothetical protein